MNSRGHSGRDGRRRKNRRSKKLMGVRAWEMRTTWESEIHVGSDINQDKWHNSDGKVRNIKG